jgi:DNA topoisomerase-1
MTEVEAAVEELSKSQLNKIIHDPVKSAQAVQLVYVNDTIPGILRKKRGTSFSYAFEEKSISDEEEIKRIKSLVIPPAWENVWICALQNGHLQATGFDVKNRKQYRYHPFWNMLRNHTKFFRMLQFGKLLPEIRLQVEKDLSLPGLPQAKILATIVSLMERTNIRVGSNIYEKLYGSFGLTTLKDKHVDIKGNTLKFSFVGKKGVHHDISLKNKKLANIVQKSKDIPGKELFQYYDEEHNRHSIDSGMVNEYLKNICHEDFTAKDFRTWAGTVNAFIAFREIGLPENVTAAKKNIVAVLDEVAKHLGNTRTVCKKYYVHPSLISLYENNGMNKYFSQLDKLEIDDNKTGLTSEEKIIMKILNDL